MIGGILRPYDPSAIRTSKVSIRMEDIDDKMEMEGEEFVSEYPKLEIKQHWTVIAYNVCRVSSRQGNSCIHAYNHHACILTL